MIKDFTESFFNTMLETRVDEGKGILYRCCVLSSQSKNNRLYTTEALSDAHMQLNQGKIKSFVDHSLSPTGNSVHTILGAFRNPVIEGDKVFSDLLLLQEGHFKNLVVGLAKEMPEVCGFSICAKGTIANKLTTDGREIVTELQLRSIDLVANPACTDGLFEQLSSREPLDPKVKELITAIRNRRRCFDEVGEILNVK